MFCSNAGYQATWDVRHDRPVRRPVARDAELQHPAYDREKWLEGYEAGLRQCAAYRQGLTAGLAGEVYRSAPADHKAAHTDEGWCSGYHRGRRHFLLNKILPLATPVQYVLVVCFYPDEDYATGERSEGGVKHTPLTPWDIAGRACGEILYEDADPPTTWAKVLELVVREAEGDGSFCQANVVTAQQAKKDKDEDEFQEMERIAVQFAASSGYQMGTMKFLRALDRAVNQVRRAKEHWNNPERRMEEWAAHMYAGSREAYFDDLNFENGRFEGSLDNLRRVYEYIERKFPLLMMRYKHHKARRRRQRKS